MEIPMLPGQGLGQRALRWPKAIRRPETRKQFITTLEGYLFLAPFLVVYCVFRIYPVFRGIYISLFDWDLVGGYRHYIGLENYREMFQDDRFWASLWHTVYFVLLSTPLIVIVGLLLAVAVNRTMRGMAIFRTVFFAPYALSISVVTLIWVMVLNASPNRGFLANFMTDLGLQPIRWLTDLHLAMPAIVITTLWWTVGFNMLLFLAGLQDIPKEVYEAARIDGAGRWALLRRITLPLLKPTMILVAILQVIASFQIFGQVYLMTRGGPANATRVLVQYIYETGFRDWFLGYASAMSVVLFAIMFVISLLQVRFSPKAA
jgi:multiple sugar transport system permease protein